MKKMKKSSLKTLILSLALIVGTILTPTVVKADYTEGADAISTLKYTIGTGSYTYITGNKIYDFTANRYKISGGGNYSYMDLISNQVYSGQDSTAEDDYFDSEKFTNLRAGSKQAFLGDVFTIANAVANDTANNYHLGSNAPSDDTVQDFMRIIQNQTGMGSQLLATLLQNTKPDYVAANRIYEPFSGVVGTILGVISVFIMALLGITMALDIAFITIPAFQLMMGGDGETNGQSDSNKMSKLISSEARQAVKANNDSGGAGGQAGGQDKQALGIYFKKRWKSLVLLGICLLYLVQGQIYSLVAWIIDLLSGFLGF